jgi:uncharacterized protein YdiU (UPF0061 family)
MKTLSLDHRLKALLIPALLLCFSSAQAASESSHLKSLSEIPSLSAGAPTALGKQLGPNSYVTVQAQKLTQAKVVWLNWDYLSKAGFDVGNRELTPEIEKAVLDAFAWGVRAPGEPESAFSSTETKNFSADRYGGDGLAGNMGSGRAASAGDIQIKGIGKTELVTTIGPGHSNGTAEIEEAIREAIYGEVGQVLPYGANRVIAVLDRGTTTTFEGGHTQTNALIVREDSLRPAHYMKNLWGRGPLLDSEDLRTQEALSYFTTAFPVPKDLQNASRPEQIRGAVLAYADRVAEQLAAAFALKIYHGATSISNIEVSARFIDYGTITTLPDYGKVKIIPNNDPFGETAEFNDILMLEFLQNIRDQFPNEIAAHLPTDKEMGDRFFDQYRRYQHREFLRLTGLSLRDTLKIESHPESWMLTELMLRVATDGAKTILDPQVSDPLTKYNLNRILVKMAGVQSLSPRSLEAAILSEMGAPEDHELRRGLIRAYINVMQTTAADRTGMLVTAQNRNAEHPETFRWNLYRSVSAMVKNYLRTGDVKKVSQQIDGVVHQYRAPAHTVLTCKDLFRAI